MSWWIDPPAMNQGGTLYYLQGDHLGSTNVVADANGVLVSRQTYYPFGGQRTTTGSTLPTDYTFTGQKLDKSTGGQADGSDGLMYYNARYYDPYLNRFVQADTIVPNPGNPQSLNRYSYVLNNPVRFIDPTGHCEGDADDPDNQCYRELRRIEHDFQGVHIDPAGWTTGELQTILKALTRFSSSVGGVDAAMKAIGGVTFAVNNGEWLDNDGRKLGAHQNGLIRLPHSFFDQAQPRTLLGPQIGIVHELAHYWDWNSGDTIGKFLDLPTPISNLIRMYTCPANMCELGPTWRGRLNPQEEWAETVAGWVYPEYFDILRAEGDPYHVENLDRPPGQGGPGLGGLHVTYLFRQIFRLGGWHQ